MQRRSFLSLLPAAGALPDGCWIDYATGREWVTGQRYGSFLVHCVALRPSGHGWKCTHMASGCSTSAWLFARDSAVEMARALEPLMDWSRVRGKDDVPVGIRRQAKALIGPIVERDNEKYCEAQP